MTHRDRMVLGVLGAVVALAAFWFIALGPKRQKASDLGSQVAQQQKRVDTAQATLAAGEQARTAYPFNYATVARLGKAVPADDDVPSLVYQLSTTSNRTGVDFRSLKLESGGSTGSSPPPPPATISPGSSSSSSSGTSSSGSGSSGSSGSTPSGQTGTSSGAGSTGTPGSTTAASSSTTPAAATASNPAAAVQSATATLPPGAVVGDAGFATMPFSFTFQGSFFRLADFFNRLERYIVPRHDDVDVTGRLLMIDGISLTAGSGGFPEMKAAVAATTYLLPSDQGLLAGATPSAPGAPAGQSVSTTTPPPPTAPAAVTALK